MFSEKQIKNIVNQGIQEGEINASKKLYAHNIVDKGGTEYVLITNSKDSLVGKTLAEIQALFSSSSCLRMIANNRHNIIGLADDSADGFCVASNGSGIETIGDDFESVDSDEVEEF